MDLARAIHKIDPKARYLLNHSVANGMQIILEWRAPGSEPTASMLRDAWDLCLEDDLADLEKSVEQEKATLRVKADPAMVDLVLALDL